MPYETLKTIQWNIHGGEIRSRLDDPQNKDAYTIKDLGYIIDTLYHENPDLITLQETNWYSPYLSQARTIAQKLGLFRVEAPFSQSPFEPKARLAIAILSRFPLAFPESAAFKNPNWTVEKPNGDVWDTHDKGVLKAKLVLSHRKSIRVATLHGFPPHEFATSFEQPENQPVIADMRHKLNEDLNMVPDYLIQGDFNINTPLLTAASPLTRNVVPLFMSGVPINRATLATGETVDHILFRGLHHEETRVKPTRSDHAMLVSRFTVYI
jgi:exonuclease III